MKTLIIVRHAKSSWKEKGLSDSDRPLNKKGLRQGLYVKDHLIEYMTAPDLIYCSHSLRTKQTCEFIQESFTEKITCQIKEELYLPSLTDMTDLIKETDDNIKKLMLIGHNPASTILGCYLAREQSVDHLHTLDMAELTLDINCWQELDSDCGTISQMLHFKV